MAKTPTAKVAELVETFDVSAMTGMSFALFQPRYADARSLRTELAAIAGSGDHATSGAVRLLLISRLNALLAIARSPKALHEMATWVERLDQGTEATEDRIFIYRVQNGRAADLQTVLSKLLNGNASDSASGTAAGRGATGAGGNDSGDAGGSAVPGAPEAKGQNANATLPYPALSAAPRLLTDPLPNLSDSQATTQASDTSHVSIIADEPNNALIIRATEHDYRKIAGALARLDVAPLQVLIEAVVAEVTLTKELQYGVQWFLRSGNLSGTQSASSSGTVAPSLPGLGAIYSAKNINVVLSALDSITTVKVVSSPSMLVLNNKTASLLVGDQVPIATQQATSVTTAGAPIVNSIEYKDTGVILKVTPHVNDENLVSLDISQEVSAVATSTASTLGSPVIQQRKFASTVSIRDGETIALGGMISDSREGDSTGIPVLGSLPLVGNLFKTVDNKINRTELIVLITPHVARSDQDLRAITRQLKDQLSSGREQSGASDSVIR